MLGNKMVRADHDKRSEDRLVVERAYRAWHFIDGKHALRMTPRRVGNRHRTHEFFRVGMPWSFEHRAAWPDLDDLPEIHDRHPMADPLDYGHVMRNEQVCHAEFTLQIEHQVHDL